MVYHDQNRIKAVGEWEVGDEVHRDLLEGACAFGGDRGERGVGRVGVDFVGLASSAAGDEFADEGGHAGPPIVFLEHRNGAEVSTVGASEGFVNVFDQGVVGRFRYVEATFVIKGALVEVPVLGGGSG